MDKKGLRACLMQYGLASRALSEVEMRYRQIEQEMLSVVYGLTRFHTYTYGRHVFVYNDHKPLAGVFKKTAEDNPLRRHRLLIRLLEYDFSFIYVKEKDLFVVDTLGRSQPSNHKRSMIEKEIESVKLTTESDLLDTQMSEIRVETRKNKVLSRLIDTIASGWPERKSEIPSSILTFWNVRNELSSSDGVMFRGDRIVLPKALQSQFIYRVHKAHTGLELTLRRARAVA